MAKERLDKLIASTGRWSRREVKTLVREGRVLVDGRIAGSAEEKYDAESCCIAVNGEELVLRRYTYVMLHKPAGVLSATEDGRGRTVLDLLTPELRKIGVFPVGRLDKDTEGLLLLTDDGELAHALLSPKKHVDKVYYARVSGRLTPEDCAAFEAGKPGSVSSSRLSNRFSLMPVSWRKLSLLHSTSCVSGRKTIMAKGAESMEDLPALATSSVISST